MTLSFGAEIAQQSPEVQVNGTLTNLGTYRAIGSAFDEVRKTGRVKEGDLISMVAFGSGLAWGSALVRW